METELEKSPAAGGVHCPEVGQNPHSVSDSCIHWHSFIVYSKVAEICMIKNTQFDRSPQTNSYVSKQYSYWWLLWLFLALDNFWAKFFEIVCHKRVTNLKTACLWFYTTVTCTESAKSVYVASSIWKDNDLSSSVYKLIFDHSSYKNAWSLLSSKWNSCLFLSKNLMLSLLSGRDFWHQKEDIHYCKMAKCHSCLEYSCLSICIYFVYSSILFHCTFPLIASAPLLCNFVASNISGMLVILNTQWSHVPWEAVTWLEDQLCDSHMKYTIIF